MCGIAGIVDLSGEAPPSKEALKRMLAALRHRGPDEFGLYLDRRAGLAHARLSIIDLAMGQQPMTNEDGTLWVTFNGEIFNYVELRKDLAARGHHFATQSDTEVIVHAWEEWGPAALSRLNGQWALALWDRRERRLILARDRIGIRPLYVCRHRGSVLFASEVKALFAAEPTLPRELDPIGIDQTLTFWSIVPPRSVFVGIEELEPGHVMQIACHRSGGAPVIDDRAYYEPQYPRGQEGLFRGSMEDAGHAVRDALETATSLRMLRSDVPVGSYLSGGLDSSLVATMGLAAKGERFHTFSIRFDNTEYDETAYQRMMVDRIGSEHHELMVTSADIADSFPGVVHHTERPILRTAPAPLYLLSRLVREHGIKVVLTGEGADEMFAGYDLFREGLVRRFWARAPQSNLRPRLLERLYPYLARSPVAQKAMAQHFFGQGLDAWRRPGFAHGTRWQTTSALKRLLSAEFQRAGDGSAGESAEQRLLASLPAAFADWSYLAQDQYLEVRTLLAGYIMASQGDRMLMAHSVEGRFPFLDCNVVALANSLPDRYKLRVLDEKHIIKRVAGDLLPAPILDRKKQPYRAPDALAFAMDDRPGWIDELISEQALKNSGVFAVEPVRRLWKKCRSRAGHGQFSNTDNMALVGVLSTQLLCHQLLWQPRRYPIPEHIRLMDYRHQAIPPLSNRRSPIEGRP